MTAEVKVVPSGWRTMESAPRDGTEIVAHDETTGTSHVTYTDQWGRWNDPDAHYYSEAKPFVPTHWTPLPVAPGEAPASPPAETGEGCKYCGPGMRTGLPGNACENCMGTGLSNPPEDTGGIEAAAWAWVQNRYPNDAASDLAFDANEMVDAYLAGSGAKSTHPASDQSDTERMRKAVDPEDFRIVGEWIDAGEWPNEVPSGRVKGLWQSIAAALAEKAADK